MLMTAAAIKNQTPQRLLWRKTTVESAKKKAACPEGNEKLVSEISGIMEGSATNGRGRWMKSRSASTTPRERNAATVPSQNKRIRAFLACERVSANTAKSTATKYGKYFARTTIHSSKLIE